jgi:predicted RNase H-like nuclease (RuvC/YqgF family)
MAEEIRHHSTRVKRRRRHKSSVTNINIFALAGGEGPPREPQASAGLEAVGEDDLLRAPMVSSEWLERRAKRLEKQEQEMKQRALELERRESELDEREARFEADMYLREDEIEARERQLADLEARLGQKESDLSSFVARVQGRLLADAG